VERAKSGGGAGALLNTAQRENSAAPLTAAFALARSSSGNWLAASSMQHALLLPAALARWQHAIAAL